MTETALQTSDFGPTIQAALAAAGGGGGGGTVYNITVPVEVQVNGAEARNFDERKIAVMVRDEIGQALRGRGR